MIGVVILNYKDYKTTEKMCNIIKNYKSIDYITIVDNNSPNESYEYLKQLEDIKVSVIKTPKNGGYAFGNNYGVNYILDNKNVDYIYIANPDVSFDEDFIIKTSKALKDNICEATSGIMLNGDNSLGIKGIRINTYLDDLLECTLFLNKFKKKYKKISDLPNDKYIDVEFLYGSLFGIKAEVFREIGGFDENTFLYCEERILGTKMKQKGYSLKIIRDVSFYHLHSVSINKCLNKINQIKQLYKSRMYYRKKYTNISKTKLLILNFMMKYGIFVRKIVYGIIDLFK